LKAGICRVTGCCSFFRATFKKSETSVVDDFRGLFLVTFTWRVGDTVIDSTLRSHFGRHCLILPACVKQFVLYYYSFWRRTLLLTVSRYFTKWLKIYCSIQCDIWNSLQRWNTENIKVLTNRAWKSYIHTNTSCRLFL
jgi:hypothetical protein